MATIDVLLPDPIKDCVDAQARSGRYIDDGDYARDLIRRDQEKSDTLATLEREIDEVFGAAGAKARAPQRPGPIG